MRTCFITILLAVHASRICVSGAARYEQVVIGWGDNATGEATGTPFVASPEMPADVAARRWSTGAVLVADNVLTGVKAVVADNGRGLALRTNGTVVCWGATFVSEPTGEPSVIVVGRTNSVVTIKGRPIERVVGISAGMYHSLALKADGDVAIWGWHSSGVPTVPAGLSNVVAISAGYEHSLALRQDGTLVGWGDARSVQPPPDGLSNMVAVAAARGLGGLDMALTKDGTVIAWQVRGIRDRPTVPPGLSNVVAIASGWRHCLALRADGTVVGWLGDAAGEATGVPKPRDYKDLSYISGAGVVTINGKLLDGVTAIAAGNQFSMALRKDGTVVVWGRPPHVQPLSAPADLNGVTGIAAGDLFCLAITTNTAPWLAAAQPVPPR